MTEGAASSSLEPETGDSKLEQWIEKAAAHAVHLPAMWRAMKTAELHAIVPCDPDSSGEFEIEKEEGFVVVTLEDADGTYAPVFARVEQGEEACAKLGGKLFGVASLNAAALVEMLAQQGHRVVINPLSGPRVSITPDTIRALVGGNFSAHRQAGDRDRNQLIPIPPAAVPLQLLLAVRGFCDRRRGLTGLFLCHPVDAESLKSNTREFRFYLRMRQLDDQLCKDFKQAATGAVPTHHVVICQPVLDSHTDTAAFLEHAPALWPA